jgi:hypothetical protein
LVSDGDLNPSDRPWRTPLRPWREALPPGP